MTQQRNQPKPLIGWREWVSLPELGIKRVKAKVDTGARSSSLHAFDVHVFARGGRRWVRFKVHPIQHDSQVTNQCETELHDERWITSSNGVRQYRPVIRVDILFGEDSWPIDLTLTSRDVMGFRMLLGREAIRPRFAVDPGRSFLIKNQMPKKTKKKSKPKRKRAGA